MDSLLVPYAALPRWPASITPKALYYPNAMLTYPDGSYMTVGSNAQGIYLSRFNADDTRYAGWPELKTLDLVGYVSSLGCVHATMTPDEKVVITASVQVAGGQYDTFVAIVDGNGDNIVPPLFYNYQSGYNDDPGGIVMRGNDIIIIAQADPLSGDSLLYYLRLNSALQVQRVEGYTDFANLHAGGASINPDGLIYVTGGIGNYSCLGEGQGLFGWINADNPDDHEFYAVDIQPNPGDNFDNALGSVTWTPFGAVAGGNGLDCVNSIMYATRLVYTAPPPPDPNDVDNDGDSFTENQGDCDDANANIYPEADEICGNGIDENCDGIAEACPPDPDDVDDDHDGSTENEGDCNDSNAAINPEAVEICGNGIDENCDGIDENCPPDPDDVDDDHDGYTENQGDCNDANANINPEAEEICGNSIDENCDGEDETCPPDPDDVDDDYDGYTENQGDCNDSNAGIHPEAIESCGNSIDENCDGIDETCPLDPNDGNYSAKHLLK